MAESGSLRPGWTVRRFDEIAVMVNDRVDSPEDAGVDRYVGLEHLDPDSLKIRRWGSPSDVTATKLRFRSGDIIFGRRRVYQRKLAVADFEGICSAHAMVLRAKPDAVVPEFLPFFMQSEQFMNRALEISVGSLSPTINWKTLAKQEFALPPLEEQQRIAGILGRSAELVNELARLQDRHAQLLNRYLIDTFNAIRARCPSKTVESFGEATMGRQKAPRYRQGKSPHPYLRVGNVGWLELEVTELEEMDFTPRELDRYRLHPGDIVLTEGDLTSEFNVGRPAIFEGGIEDCAFQNTLIRLRPKPDISPTFLLLLLEGARLNQLFARAAKTTTVTHLGLGRFKGVELPMPPSRTQAALAQEFSEFLASRKALSKRKAEAQATHWALVEGALI